MKAIIHGRYGAPEVLTLGELDQPAVADDAVLVRVHATSVNAYDWHMLRGKPYLARLSGGLPRPKSGLLGLDVAGIVEAVGQHVTGLQVGDKVFGSRAGGFAEYVNGRTFVPMPAGFSFEQASALPTAGITALKGLRDHGNLRDGQRVLVNGAGGGVGTFAVQIAKAFGAHVTGVTKTSSLRLVESIGADEVIDYLREDFTDRDARYDVILDAGGNHSLSELQRALTPTGRAALAAPGKGQWVGPIVRMAAAGMKSRLSGQTFRSYLVKVTKADLLAMKELTETGQVTPSIDRTYEFDQVADAIRYVESGLVQGKVVVRI